MRKLISLMLLLTIVFAGGCSTSFPSKPVSEEIEPEAAAALFMEPAPEPGTVLLSMIS